MSSATTTTKKFATRIDRFRNNTVEEMEIEYISIWIDDEINRNMSLSQAIKMEKARTKA